MPYCPKCGKETSSEARYCPYCGANLEVYKKMVEDLSQEKNRPFKTTTVHSDFLLQERIAEARHSAIVGLAMVFGGLFLAVFGMFLSGITKTGIEWHGILPKMVTYHPYALTSIGCVMVGVILAAVGAIIGGYYDIQKDKLMKKME
ncbi:MAG TPA: hypothetical protein C5S37_07485 [Methanophagales archaeon]|nr:hypothetical protein [Methanophagales archaeon]HJH26606.1 hypothetical protein [Methanophagales archaeon]